MNIGTGHSYPGLKVIEIKENRTDYFEENDIVG